MFNWFSTGCSSHHFEDEEENRVYDSEITVKRSGRDGPYVVSRPYKLYCVHDGCDTVTERREVTQLSESDIDITVSRGSRYFYDWHLSDLVDKIKAFAEEQAREEEVAE